MMMKKRRRRTKKRNPDRKSPATVSSSNNPSGASYFASAAQADAFFFAGLAMRLRGAIRNRPPFLEPVKKPAASRIFHSLPACDRFAKAGAYGP
jgi:hypothetical protein